MVHIKQIGKKASFLVAITFAAVIGGVTTALVSAAIPDGGGTIHGCYGKITGNVRVIDTEAGKRCTSLENIIAWNANGGNGGGIQKAYAKFAASVPYDQASLDPSFTSGIGLHPMLTAGVLR